MCSNRNAVMLNVQACEVSDIFGLVPFVWLWALLLPLMPVIKTDNWLWLSLKTAHLPQPPFLTYTHSTERRTVSPFSHHGSRKPASSLKENQMTHKTLFPAGKSRIWSPAHWELVFQPNNSHLQLNTLMRNFIKFTKASLIKWCVILCLNKL